MTRLDFSLPTLTDKSIRKHKPAEKPFKLTDGRGLYLLVKPNGGRYWRMDHAFGGKRKLLAFGVYPDVSLQEAREKQAEARKLIRAGIDPMEAKRARKRQDETERLEQWQPVRKLDSHA